MFIYLIMLLSLFSDTLANSIQELSTLTSSLNALSENIVATQGSSAKANELKLIAENKEGMHLSTEYRFGNYKVLLIIQDILQQPADAIVNAANSGCLGGGGIDGIISNTGGSGKHKADEETTLYDLRVKLPVIGKERCPLSEGRITRGGWLQYPYDDPKVGNHKLRKQFNYVIHAVGPQCHGGITATKKQELASTYVNVLKRVDVFNKNPKDGNYPEFSIIDISDLGNNYQIRSLNFPTISTGIFGCTTDETAGPVVTAVYDLLRGKPDLNIRQINFVFWDPVNRAKAKKDYMLYKEAFEKHLKN